MIKGIDHIGIAVKNIDEAKKFWVDTLGLKHHHTEEVPEQKVRYETYTTCQLVREEHCQMLTKRRCYLVPEQKVQYIPYTTCHLVREDHCNMVTQKRCHMVPMSA